MMLSIKKCKEILQGSGKNYSDEEAERIRDLLYQFGYIDYEQSNQQDE